jgi:hypothetical protein
MGLMLSICCPAYFEKVKAEATQRGLMADLQDQLDYLANYACHDDDAEKTRCQLHKDFAPLSFEFVMERRDTQNSPYKYWFNGGLIFHPGPGEPDNTFAVELSPSQKPHWSVHT